MIKRLYPIIAGSLAFLLANSTFENIHAHPITKTAAPYVYRPLVANLWPVLNDAVGPFVGSWVVWFLSLSLLMFLIDEIGGRLELDVQKALLATIAITPPIVLLQPAGAFWNVIEAVFFAAALLMIIDGRTWSLYPLVILATLNRETAVFIPLMFFAVTRDWKHAAGLGLVWVAVYGAIRLIVGPVPPDLSLAFIFSVNIGSGFGRFALGLLMISWLFWYSWKGWHIAPDALRRAAYIVPAYIGLIAVFGIWHEWRLVLSIYPLLVPLAAVWVEWG